MAGLQAQASTANVAQAQKAEAFTPSGRLQRQGLKNVEQLERFAAHIKQQIERHNKICQYMMEDATVPAFGNALLSNFVGNKTQKFAYVPAWEETLEKLNEAIAFHKNHSPAPANSGVFGGASKIKQQLKHAYLSHKFRLNNLGRYLVLPQMEFSGLDLSGATLDGGNFTGASFAGANLDRASLRKTRLKGTNFNFAFLCRTSFEGARISRRGSNPTIFYGAYDLDKAPGLPKGIDTSRESLEAWW
jgi:uncharacterized protein YjbI with pentapeptide repeats